MAFLTRRRRPENTGVFSVGGLPVKGPTLPILFVTGFADRTALAHVDEAHIIRKPLSEDELAAKVRLALADRTASKVVRLRG
jgi:FixJ family two-component response regulator